MFFFFEFPSQPASQPGRLVFGPRRHTAHNTCLPRTLDSEGRAEEIETKQREQAQKREEGQGHWDESLASDGEAAVCFLLPVP